MRSVADIQHEIHTVATDRLHIWSTAPGQGTSRERQHLLRQMEKQLNGSHGLYAEKREAKAWRERIRA